ncbi:unnamed protein product [Effrenium voratum]|nr:unnamed protein product [Effrenium voratum]
MTPGFTSLTDPASYGCLADTQLLQLWVPGAVAGVGMFALRATNVKVPRIPQDLLIPAVLLAEALSFCGWMLVTGRGLEEARAQGLLFNVTLPEHPVFYRVWTKHFDPSGPKVDWQEFAAPSFWLTVVNAACISVLTAVMNIFGTMAATRFRVDIDREMMLHGIYNVGSGALSGLTANMVMSFSITCRTLGADGQQFQVLLFVFSGLVFLFGDYVVAVIPKLLPGSVLIWLSAELMAFWVWNALRFLRPYEYCLVWIMIGLYVVMGTAPMMLFGFIAVAGIVQAQLATLPVIRTRQTLAGKLRSSRLHTTCDREFLNRIGAQAEVWILGAAYLYFASMRQLVQALENFSSQRHVAYQSPKRAEKDEELPEFGFSHAVSCEARLSPEYIIIDLDVVRQMESTAVSAFQEILSVAKEQACVLILARPDPCVLQQMENFQLPLRRLHEAPVPLPEDELGGDALLVAETLDQALEFVEESFLQAYQPAPGQCRGHDHSQIRRRLASFVGPSLALHGVFLDFHVWLDGYFPSYHPQIFEHLAPFLEIRKLQEREVLYRAPPFRSLQRGGAWMCEAEKGKEPPLVWLLQGGADHIWNPNSETEQSVRAFEDMYRLSPGSAFEKARIVEKRGSWCAGPFSTARAFLAGSAHPGTLISTDASTVAILRQQAFEELPGHLRRIVTAYLLRQMPTYVRT